jgi:nucleotide-binding universal stress UspA family protein
MLRSSIRSILVGSDLSAGSDAVVRAAADLAEQTGAPLHVLHAFEFLGAPLRDATLDLAPLRTLVRQSRERLRDQLARVVPESVPAGTVKLDYQRAPDALLARATEVGADVIVLGPHQSLTSDGERPGGTVRSVVEEASVPCLVTRGPVRFPLRRVLLPVGRPDVRRGLLAAGAAWLAALRRQQEARLATGRTTELRVLHAARLPHEWRAFSGELTEELQALRGRGGAGDHLDLQPSIAWGRSPAAEVTRFAREMPVDLIALGIRGHGPLLRSPLGGVSSDVLHDAPAPVLVLPARMFEDADFPGTRRPGTGLQSAPGDALVLEPADPFRDPDAGWSGAALRVENDDGSGPRGARLTR